MIDDFFNLDDIQEPANPKLTAEDFARKTKSLIVQIANAYGAGWYSRRLKEEEWPAESICETCPGCGTFADGKECYRNNEEGECYERCFDSEAFADTLQDLMFEQKDFFLLLDAEIMPNQGETPEPSVATDAP